MTAERLWTTHIRVVLAGLVDEHPGWTCRYDSAGLVWLASVAVDGGHMTLSASDPERLAALIRGVQSQTLVIP